MMQHCNRCGGQTITHYAEIKCLQCGHDQQPKITTTDSTILEKEAPRHTDARLWRKDSGWGPTNVKPILTTPEDIAKWKKNR